MDINNFYASILNLKTADKSVIEKIVLEERKSLQEETTDLTGFCKYLASVIEEKLKSTGINTTYIDLNELNGVDHVVLISEYKEDNNIKRVLIDPTFSQFTKNDSMTLVGLKEWPSERINPTMKDNLLEKGLTDIDNNSFNEYLNSFTEDKKEYSLDEIILSNKSKKL